MDRRGAAAEGGVSDRSSEPGRMTMVPCVEQNIRNKARIQKDSKSSNLPLFAAVGWPAPRTVGMQAGTIFFLPRKPKKS
jgi:hypothetical protein